MPDPLVRVARWGALGGTTFLLVAALVGWAIDGRAGLVGAVLGVGVPLAFFGVTVLTALLTRRLSPGAMGATVLGSWIVKMAALIGVLVLMDGSDAWSRPVFAVCFGLAVPAWLAFEAWVVIKTRQPYTAPAS
mgnify:CR=1 FL=1|jgi:hypothetical protein